LHAGDINWESDVAGGFTSSTDLFADQDDVKSLDAWERAHRQSI